MIGFVSRQHKQRPTYVDPDGVEGRERGTGDLASRQLRRLLDDPAVKVVHARVLEDPVVVPFEARAAFWAEAQRRMAASIFAEFTGTAWTDDRHHRLLLVAESC